MATGKMYKNLEFVNSDISGVTAVHITQNATVDEQAVRLVQLTAGLATKQDALLAGNAIDPAAFTGGTLNVLFDNATLGLDGSGNLFLNDGAVTEAKLDSGVDAETFQTTAHAWVTSGISGGTIQDTFEQIDAAIQAEKLSIATGSADLLDITGNELSVKQLLITDTTVDATATGITAFAAANYTGSEFQEGDLIILTAATDAADRAFIHNGGVAGDQTDFTRITSTIDTATIRAAMLGGDGITYNTGTGEIEVSVDGTSLELSATDGTGVVQIAADGVNDTHIDFGTGATQVNADDLPVIDTAGNFTGSTVEAVLDELFDIIAAGGENLAQTLALGNTTSGNSILMTTGDLIKAASNDNQINLTDGTGFSVTTDGGAFAEAFLYGDATSNYLGYGGNSAGVFGNRINMTIATGVVTDAWSIQGPSSISVNDSTVAKTNIIQGVAVFNVDSAAQTYTGNPSADAGISINSGKGGNTHNQNVAFSAAIGGGGMTIKTDDTAYLNQASFQQSGNAFDTIVAPSAATADRTQTLQDADGTIALLENITAKEFDTTVTLVASTPLTVTHSLNTNKIVVDVWDSAGNNIKSAVDIVRTSVNAITIESNSALANIEVFIYALG